jgi:acyl carrier protein
MAHAAGSATEPGDLYTFVAAMIARELKIEQVQLTPTLDLRSIAGIESIKVLRIISKVEQQYDVELEDEAVFRVNTIQDIVDAVRNAAASGK